MIGVFRSGRHVRRPKRRPGRVVGIAVIGASLLLAGVAMAVDDYSVEVPNRTQSKTAAIDDGAIVQYIGDLDTTFGSAGSGIFNSFVRMQGNNKKTAVQKGYNTDGAKEFDTKSGAFTHSILLSEIPTIEVGGDLYWEFFADINDSNANDPTAAQISLDDFELWLTDDPNLSGYSTFAAQGADEIYDYTDHFAAGHERYIKINDVNQGSGRGDLRYLVPQDGFDIGDCNYGNPACTTYLVLYSVWGGLENYGFDGGFEEWKVKRYPVLQVTKTATPSYTRTFDWTVEKSATPDHDLFDGDTGDSTYTVTVTKSAGTDSGWAVNGVITIVGDDDTSVDATITDTYAGNGATITSCSVPVNTDGTYTIAAGATVTCSYEIDLGSALDGTNVARATFTVDGVDLAFQGTAGVTFGDPTTLVNDSVDVTDTFDGGLETTLATVSSSTTLPTYDRTFDCSNNTFTGDALTSDTVSYNNTAKVKSGSTVLDSDSASVDVTCYRPSIEKDATATYQEKWTWTIDKSADKSNIEIGFDGSATINYQIDLDASSVESKFAVSGDITIANPHPSDDLVITDLTDVLTGDATTVSITGCTGTDVTYGGGTLTVEAGGGPAVCAYSASPTGRSATKNTASFTLFGNTYTANAAVNWVVTEIDEKITLTDTNAAFAAKYGDPVVVDESEVPKSFTYSVTVLGSDLGCGDHQIDNTAEFTTNDTGTTGDDDVTVYITVICGDSRLTPTQTECVNFAFDRDNPLYNLDALLYQGSPNITNVTPGAMFYWIEVNHTGGALTVNVMQDTAFSREITALDVKLFDSGCIRINAVNFTLNGGDATLTANLPAGVYYMQVRYDPKSLQGAPVPAGGTATFSFDATINGTDTVIGDSLTLQPK